MLQLCFSYYAAPADGSNINMYDSTNNQPLQELTGDIGSYLDVVHLQDDNQNKTENVENLYEMGNHYEDVV